MDGLEEKLGAVLNNPQLMQQIMSMAQAMGNSSSPPQEQTPPPANAPTLDPGMLQRLSGLAGQTGVDQNQQSLLHALGPYVSRDRIQRLERAMRAAKMARMATAFLGASGLLSQTSR